MPAPKTNVGSCHLDLERTTRYVDIEEDQAGLQESQEINTLIK